MRDAHHSAARRRGFSLLEVILISSLTAFVLSYAATVVARIGAVRREMKEMIHAETGQHDLLARLRAEIHAADEAEIDEQASALMLSGRSPDGAAWHVRYRLQEEHLQRRSLAGERVLAAGDEAPWPGGGSWRRTGRLVEIVPPGDSLRTRRFAAALAIAPGSLPAIPLPPAARTGASPLQPPLEELPAAGTLLPPVEELETAGAEEARP